MLINADGKPIGATPNEAAAIAAQTIADKARGVLAALEVVGIKITAPVEVRVGTVVVLLGKDGPKLETVKSPGGRRAKVQAPSPPAPVSLPGTVWNEAPLEQPSLLERVRRKDPSVAADVIAGMSGPPPS